MNAELTAAFAKLAGIRKAIQSVLDDAYSYEGRPLSNFDPREVETYFYGTAAQLSILRNELKTFYVDFKEIDTVPNVEMTNGQKNYRIQQVEALARDIDQIFEIRANSEVSVPKQTEIQPRVFISHGRAKDWMDVQSYIEKDIGVPTLELAQEPNLGRTVLQKLEEESSRCTCAVIVVTGDDADSEGNLRARENVMHEIGYFQAKFGLSSVCLLHQEGTSIPSNIHGLVYIPFPPGYINATYGSLIRELDALYKG